MSYSLRQRQTALYVYFLIPGVALATWVTRTPAIRDAIGASIADMGLVLGGLSGGAMCGVLAAGHIVARKGTKFTMLTGLGLACMALFTIALGVILGLKLVVAIGLAFFGWGMGSADIALNMDASVVESETGKPIMHTLHGCFSLGTFVGALIGLAANHLDAPVSWHMLAVFAVLATLLARYAKFTPSGTGIRKSEIQTGPTLNRTTNSAWRDPRVWVIGVIVFAIAMSEGAAYDWLPILLVDEHGFSAALGALVFVIFAGTMTIGRLGGGLLIKVFGRAAVMRGSIALAGVGIACMVWGHSQILAGFAVICWGLGASLGFPLALTAAGEGDEGGGERVKAVATIGYMALLVGPPSLGFIGETFGLRGAMTAVLCLVALALLATRYMHENQ